MSGNHHTHSKPSRSIAALAAVFLAIFLAVSMSQPEAARAVGPPYNITTDPGGGDCSQIGTWNAGTSTCTLSQDLTITTEPAITLGSNNITLDGGGHYIQGNSTNTGVWAQARTNVNIRNLEVRQFYTGVELYNGSSNNVIYDNRIHDNQVGIFIFYNNSINNVIASNVVENNAIEGIQIFQTGNNEISNNVIRSNNSGIYFSQSNNNMIFNNHFYANSTQVSLTSSTGNVFNDVAPVGGNYWYNHDTAAEGCANTGNDRFCDDPYTYVTGVTDNLPLARREYYFTWYDYQSAGAKNWMLMTNPIEAAGEDAWFDLAIAGVAKAIPAESGYESGQVPPLGGAAPTYPGVMGGPVNVGYHARMQAMVSQRVLWGDSLEEVTGTDAARLSDHYYWNWYDMKSPGFKNWILVDNPGTTETVTVDVSFTDRDTGLPVTASQNVAPSDPPWTPTFPGKMGGPVEVKAYEQSCGTWANPACRRDVIASQRVLTNGDTALNEVPGIPAEELGDRYEWTWYDSQDGKNWILIANPPDSAYSMDYAIFIHGQGVGGGVDLAPGASAEVMIPNTMDGPVEVITARHNSGIPLNSIVSQRVLWGPSFEEVPGLRYADLSSVNYWTWYDMSSPGVTDWVLIANPDAGNSIYYEIMIGGWHPAGGSGTIPAGGTVTPTFSGWMNGPVKVQAWTDAGKSTPALVITSQRVLWKGYLNEVRGTALF